LDPAAGRVERRSGLVISYVPQGTEGLSGSLGDFIRARGLDATRFHTVLRKLDFPRSQFEAELSRYSAGQKKMVLLAASLCEEADLYIWDEPLNYVDVLSRMRGEELILLPASVAVRGARRALLRRRCQPGGGPGIAKRERMLLASAPLVSLPPRPVYAVGTLAKGSGMMSSPSMAARMAAEVSGTVSGPKERKAALSIKMAPARPMSSRFTRWISSV
jgi:hypothetical protein